MRLISYLFLIILIVVGISFATLNSNPVTVNYYIGQRSLPLSLLMAILFGVGGLLGVLASLWLILKVKMQAYRLRQRLKMAEKEIANLRAIPLQDKH